MASEPIDQQKVAAPSLVLLVEDSPIIAMNTETLLLELGVEEVRIARCVADALALVDAAHFDLAILDLNLGAETSVPVADRLVTMHVPFVFATGVDEDLVFPEALGEVNILKKPYGVADLDRIIRSR